jgi:hypothetical protein
MTVRKRWSCDGREQFAGPLSISRILSDCYLIAIDKLATSFRAYFPLSEDAVAKTGAIPFRLGVLAKEEESSPRGTKNWRL